MVAKALDGDRIIGMVLLRPGWEGEYEGRPAIYDVGCAGLVTHAERTPDGRYNLVLRGLQKFKVLEEDHSRRYRVAAIEPIMEPVVETDRATMAAERRRPQWFLVAQPAGGREKR